MQPSFKIVLDIKTLQLLSKFLEKNTDEVSLNLKNNLNISFQGLTGHSGALIYVPKEKLKETKGEDTITIDTVQLNQLAQQFSGEFVEIIVNEARLYLKDGTNEGYVSLIQPDANKNFLGMGRQLPANFTIDAAKLMSFLKSAGNFGSYVIFDFDGDEKQLSVSTKKTTVGFKRSLEIKQSKGTSGTAMFQLDYIKDAIEGTSGDLKIEIGNEQPIKFSFNLGNAICQSFVAPRCE